MMDASTLDKGLKSLIDAVERRRGEGLSVSAACSAVGISTSTYYRRRKAAAPVAGVDGDAWQFTPLTPRAPFYWDQVFAEEMTDSFVRRELGAGARQVRARTALSVLATRQPPLLDRLFPTLAPMASRVGKRLGGKSMAAAKPFAVVAVLAMLVMTGGWMASVASDPAAWIRHPDPAKVAEATVLPPR
jgi:hypothetical protein